MGLRGPAPKPTAVRLYEENLGKRPLNPLEPRPRVIEPPCPSHLDVEGRRMWRKLVPILQRMRVLTEADGIALGNLCDSYSTMVQAQKKLRETGMLLKTPSGYVQQNPLISIVSSSMETVNKLAKEFGFTPAARTRICAEPLEQEMDEIERLLCM
jgi:P27 family predicted phage terminase small subunit